MKRAFIDASVLVAACGSATGGSVKILKLVQGGYFKAIVTELVLNEASRAVTQKMGENAALQFYKYLGEIKFTIVPTVRPLARDIKAAFPAKDHHVLIGALKAMADFLFTLDQKDFFSPKARALSFPFAILTPKMFFESLSD